jgi:hypothetical protein
MNSGQGRIRGHGLLGTSTDAGAWPAHAWYATAGIIIERMISDNGACYRSAPWAATRARLGIIHNRIALGCPPEPGI